MRTFLTCLLLSTLFSAGAQDEAQKIVKEYRRGEGPTELNNGLGVLNTETHYDKEGRTIRKIQYGEHGYKSQEVTTSYYRGLQPATITDIYYPAGFWPGTISLQHLSADHPDRKSDTAVRQYIYEDTLLLRIDYFRRGQLSTRVAYTYNAAGYEVESAVFNESSGNRERCVKTVRDGNNRPVNVQEINADGSVAYTETMTYNADGLLTGKDYTSRPFTYHVVTTFHYNSAGLLTKETQQVLSPADKKAVFTRLYDYTAQGLLIREGGLDSLGKVTWQQVHTYDSSGQKIRTQFDAFAYHYTYNAYGDLVSRRFEDSRSAVQSTERFIYETGLLRKTERYYSNELVDYTRNYYTASGKLIRQEPMPTPGKEALDWIDYFDYNEKGQLIRLNHRQPRNDPFPGATATIWHKSQKPQPKPDPYKNYVDRYTYFTYDGEGRQVNVYDQGGERTRIMPLGDGTFGIPEYATYPFSMPSTSINLIERLDTVAIETRGALRIITLKLDYADPRYPSSGPVKHYHKNLVREETFTATGEMIALKETTEDGIALYLSDEHATKSLRTHNRYTSSKAEQFQYGRYAFEQLSATFYNADSLKYLVTNANNDSIAFFYENGRLSRETRKRESGPYRLVTYDYDDNGFKTLERSFQEDGTENSRILYKNDGKHIVSEQHIGVHPNHETLFEITYAHP